MYPYINILGKQIPTYGVCVMFGIFFSAALVALMLRKRRDYSNIHILNIPLFAAIGAFLGAHIVYIFTRTDVIQFMFTQPDKAFASFETTINTLGALVGGMVFYGGLLGAIAAAAIYCKVKKLDFGLYADILAPAIPFFHAFGRVGCFLAGCCYGIKSDWGVVYHNELMPHEANGVTLLPIQLIEAGCNLLLCLLLVFLSTRRLKKGTLLGLYFALYAVIRFTDEFFRGDTIRGLWFGLSTSQWISIAVFVLGIVMLLRRYVLPSKAGFDRRVETGVIPKGYVYNKHAGAMPVADAAKIQVGTVERSPFDIDEENSEDAGNKVTV